MAPSPMAFRIGLRAHYTDNGGQMPIVADPGSRRSAVSRALKGVLFALLILVGLTPFAAVIGARAGYWYVFAGPRGSG